MTTSTRKPTKVTKSSIKSSKRRAPVEPTAITKLKQVESDVNGLVIGRTDLTRGIVLSLIAGQNILALGVPGTAKTMLVQAIAESFASSDDVFDILLTKFTKVNEVFGPVDIAALNNNSYRVSTKGYLASSKVGILDEIFKGSSAILNSLLRIANERTFRNGADVESTPMRMLVGMSNEFPDDPALLAAFFDRFPSKFMVGYLDANDFNTMLTAAWEKKAKPTTARLNDADFAELDKLVNAVVFTKEMAETLTEIRAVLNAKNVVVSDRRWVQAVKLMAAHAVYNNRRQITRRDLVVLEPIMWNTENDRSIIKQILPDYMNPFERDLRSIVDEAYHARASILKAGNFDGKDDTKPSPDIASAASEACKAVVTVRGQTARLDAIEELAEDEKDRIALQDARDSIASVDLAIRKIMRGDDGLTALANTETLDV